MLLVALSWGTGSCLTFAGGHCSFGEAKHVGALGVFGTAAAFVGLEFVLWVHLAFEARQESLAGRPSAGAAVVGAGPGDLGCYPLVDVLGQVASPPVAVCE
jgi:hypothetical protein